MDKTKPVISASRRTDLPGGYTPWFLDCIRQGEALVVNPFNRQERKVDLRPEAVHSIVLWSKNFGPFLDHGAHEILSRMGYRLFFNFTVNAPNRLLEPGLPGLDLRLAQVETLARCFDPGQINWRFDPVSFYETRGQTVNTLKGFEAIARRMAELGITRCITSFYDPYRKVDRRIKARVLAGGTAVNFMDPGMPVKQRIVKKMAALLDTLNIRLHLCCEDELIRALNEESNISPSACIDGRLLQEVLGGHPVMAKDPGQRRSKGCQCTRSVDIGSYDLHPCPHNCLFCYARTVTDTNTATSAYGKSIP